MARIRRSIFNIMENNRINSRFPASKKQKDLDEFVETFPVSATNLYLLQKVRSKKDKKPDTYSKINEVTNIPNRRLKYLLNESEDPKLNRLEIQAMCGYVGIGVDTLFNIPDTNSDEMVSRMENILKQHYS